MSQKKPEGLLDLRQGKTLEQFVRDRRGLARDEAPETEAAGPSPYGLPGVYEQDAKFISRAMGRARSPVEFYGPGAEAARQRQAGPLAPPKKPDAEAAKIANLRGPGRPEFKASNDALISQPTAAEPKRTIRERLLELRERVRHGRD